MVDRVISGFVKVEIEQRKKLLRKGVSPDTRTRKTGEAALVIAVKVGNPTVIKMILEAGANPNISNREDGETPLLQAALTGF